MPSCVVLVDVVVFLCCCCCCYSRCCCCPGWFYPFLLVLLLLTSWQLSTSCQISKCLARFSAREINIKGRDRQGRKYLKRKIISTSLLRILFFNGRHCSVNSSAPSILPPRPGFESRAHHLHFYQFKVICVMRKRQKQTKRGRYWPI